MNSRRRQSTVLVLFFIFLAFGQTGCDVIGDILGGIAAICEQTELVVTKPDDTNDGICTADDCSLREAVITSNDCPGTQTIRIPNGLYSLTLTGADEDMSRTGDLDIRDDVIISGEAYNFEGIPTADEATVIDGLYEDRIFDVQPARDLDRTSPLEVSLFGLWLQEGQADRGGAILNRGDLTMSSIYITNTRARLPSGVGGVSQGGAVLSQDNGSLDMELVFIGPSEADEGGAIYLHSGQMEWRNSEASGNDANLDGGALYVRYGATAQLEGVDFRENEAGRDGGAIYNDGELDGSALLLAANVAIGRGGGFFNGSLADVELSSSWFTNNNADRGGGIFNVGNFWLYQSGINNNTAFGNQGGGIANVRDALTPETEAGAGLLLENVTVSGNMLGAPDSPGGAGLFNDDGHLFINFSTFAYNSPDGILNLTSGERELLVRSSILAYHAAGNCHGLSGVSFGHNIDDGSTCEFDQSTDRSDTDPMLRRLADFGSGGLVHALHPDSPAVDHGDASTCVATDQRAMARPQGPNCDIGAFELDPDSLEPPPEPGEEEESEEEESEPLSVNFNADAYSLPSGQCTKLRWEVLNAEVITLDGEQVESLAAQDVCPTTTTAYRLNASNASEEVERMVTIEVTAGATIPQAPGNLNIGNVVCSGQEYTVTLNWADQADNEEGYRVFRGGALIATLGPDIKSYADHPPYGGPYTYGVEAFNSAGASARPTVLEGGCIY